MCAVPELPKYFVARVENLSDANRIELIRAIPRESLLFKGLAWVHFGSGEDHELSPFKPWYWSMVDSTSKSEHVEEAGGRTEL